MKLEKGTIFGDYTLVEKKGDGSTAEVWECYNSAGVSKAIKIFAPYNLLDDYSKELIKEEFEKSRNLIHPNLVIPEEYIEYNNIPAIVMPLLEKSMWQEFLFRQGNINERNGKYKAGVFSEHYSVLLMNNIAKALRFLHQNSLIHNDIKPANILINKSNEDNDVEFYLTDFGITREIRDTIIRQTSRHNSLTFAYAAPEKLRGHSSTISSDVFSLGASIYELVFGADVKVPVGQILNNNGVLNFSSSHYSEPFLNILNRMMEKEPNKRISIEEIIELSQSYLNKGSWPISRPEIQSQSTTGTSNFENYISHKSPEDFNIPKKKYKKTNAKDKEILLGKKWLIAIVVGSVLILSLFIYLYYGANFLKDNNINLIKINDKMYLVEKDGKVGIMDNNEEFIVPLEYESGEISGNNVKLYKDGKYEYIKIK